MTTYSVWVEFDSFIEGADCSFFAKKGELLKIPPAEGHLYTSGRYTFVMDVPEHKSAERGGVCAVVIPLILYQGISGKGGKGASPMPMPSDLEGLGWSVMVVDSNTPKA